MRYSKETTQLANFLIRVYSKFDGYKHVLDTDAIPEFDIEKLAASLLLDNKDIAHESMGPDNPCYDEMLCKFISYLKSNDTYEARAEFAIVFNRGVIAYLKDEIKTLLSLSLEYYNLTQAA